MVYHENELIKAAKNGNENEVCRLLEGDAYIDAKDDDDRTALMHAAREGYTNIVKILIEKGANIDSQDKDGLTALMLSARYSHTGIAKMLIEKGAKTDLQSKKGNTALTLAAREAHTDTAKMLVEKGANIDLQNKEGWTALMLAAEWGMYDIAKMLIEKGAKTDLQNKDGNTALISAARWKYYGIAKMLIENGADTSLKNKRGQSVFDLDKNLQEIINSIEEQILCLLKYNKTPIIKNLLQRNVNINIQDTDGKTPLIIAVQAGNKEVVDTLLAKNANINILDKDGYTALLYAVTSDQNEIREKIFLKLEDNIKNKYPEETYEVDENGKTALMRALENKKNDLAMYLMMKGEDLSKIDNEGNSVLKYLLENGDWRLVKIAFERKIDKDKISYKNTLKNSLGEAEKNVTDGQEMIENKNDDPPSYGYVLQQKEFEINLALDDNIAAVNDFVKKNPHIDEKIIRTLLENGLDVNKVEKDFVIRMKRCNDEEKMKIFGSINTLIQSNPDVASKVLSQNIAGIDVIEKGNDYKIIVRDNQTKKACLRYECKLEGGRYTFKEIKKKHHFFRLSHAMKKFVKHIYRRITLVDPTYQGLKGISEELAERKKKHGKAIPKEVRENSKNREKFKN